MSDVSPKPLLGPGPLGGFDDHGVYPSCAIEDGKALRLYYIGWNPGVTKPLFYSSIGLAWSRDGGRSFERHSSAPVLGRSRHDPLLTTSPCVLLTGNVWRVWYVSGIRWTHEAGQILSYYHIQYAESKDGIAWRPEGHVAVPLARCERNIARPSVLLNADGTYSMWYCYDAGKGYRIGYASSHDGLSWRRAPEEHPEGLYPGEAEWERESVEYPCVFHAEGRRYMLYNGDGFGRSGMGLAVWE